jgi:molecular chaperone DnaK (HSP70)
MVMGIDFGASFTRVGIWDPGHEHNVSILVSIPTVIASDKNGELVVGDGDVLLKELVSSTETDEVFVGSQRYTLYELCVKYFSGVISQAESLICERPVDVVLSVPCGWKRKKFLNDVLHQVGLENVKIIEEPRNSKFQQQQLVEFFSFLPFVITRNQNF